MEKIFFIFGDSIAYGACDWERSGWADRLKMFISKNYGAETYNLGVSGNKTTDLLKRFKNEIGARVKEESVLIIFAIGINDSQFIHSENSLGVLPSDFRENIITLIKEAQKITSEIIFLGLTPVDETKTAPIPWNSDKSYLNKHIKEYDEIIKKLCAEEKVSFIELFEAWRAINYKDLLEDGLHPNSRGHQNIFEKVRNFLLENYFEKQKI